jgi:DNA polymerase III sliding clamp (beta) subunit (PCNA family)
MTFDRKLMIDKVSNVIKSANKSTNQITFHLNGSIAMKSQDIDFNFSAESNIPYIEKTFPDTDIAFNGKFLINALNIFKDKQVKMYSEGQANRAGLISNDTDTVLIMPLMIHD